ncbi:hypothetical protein COF68_05960 [Bacillus toyonensis]|uniref:hypothetical protein n=1 Tax=Bacillus toyonensis TaxID=155322 RepID=UPI000BFD56DF|nr:hypothetical protein [Bacillus toyonensis]PHE64380.1 hypothetical protein COF68_05960 [Bacillus toyonensis]
MSRPEDTSKKPEDFIQETLEQYVEKTENPDNKVILYGEKVKKMIKHSTTVLNIDNVKEELGHYLVETDKLNNKVKEYTERINKLVTEGTSITDIGKLREAQDLAEKIQNSIFTIQLNQMNMDSLLNRAKVYKLDMEDINNYIQETLGKLEQ